MQRVPLHSDVDLGVHGDVRVDSVLDDDISLQPQTYHSHKYET